MNRGTGLSNVSRRLQLLFPDDHEISFAPREPRGTIVTVAFPVS
jgi:LytS/YehU family sensor histidine kinase